MDNDSNNDGNNVDDNGGDGGLCRHGRRYPGFIVFNNNNNKEDNGVILSGTLSIASATAVLLRFAALASLRATKDSHSLSVNQCLHLSSS